MPAPRAGETQSSRLLDVQGDCSERLFRVLNPLNQMWHAHVCTYIYNPDGLITGTMGNSDMLPLGPMWNENSEVGPFLFFRLIDLFAFFLVRACFFMVGD